MAPEWLDCEQITAEWPALGQIETISQQGSGWLLTTATGRAHLKRRPRSGMRAEMWILEFLHQRGVPVTRPLLTRTGHTHLNQPTESWFVYRELPGRALNRLLDGPGEAEQLAAECARLGLHLAAADVTTAIVEGMPVRPVTAASEGLARQVIHRDFHAGNVLFVGEGEQRQLSGLIDFDHLEIGPRLVDLVYLAGSVLAELCSAGRSGDFVDTWHRLFAGYQSVVALDASELDSSVALLIEVERDFADWFASTGDHDNAELTAAMIAEVENMAAQLQPISD